MIDLTPLDVRKKRGDFRRVLRGYDPEEVDTFLSLVTERFEELVRENLTLTERTQHLERQVGAMEGREKAIQDALVSAQKLREEVNHQSRRDADTLKEQANRSAALIKAEAESEIARRMMEAEGVMRERQRALEELERSRLKFLKAFRGLLERELDSVEVEEARKPLEEVPLELDFRRWVPSGDGVVEPETETEEPGRPDDASEEGAEEVEASDDPLEDPSEPELVVDISELDPAGDSPDPDQVEEAVTQAMEVSTDATGLGGSDAHRWGREGLKELVAEVVEGVEEVPEAAETEEGPDPVQDVHPDGGDTLLEGGTAEPGEELDPESAGSEDSAALTREPKWLFSLLKREEDEGVEG